MRVHKYCGKCDDGKFVEKDSNWRPDGSEKCKECSHPLEFLRNVKITRSEWQKIDPVKEYSL